MHRTLLLTTLALVLGSPATMGKSELEILRALCAEQERQIQQLETENSRLRDTARGPRLMDSRTQLISTTPSQPAALPANSSAAATYTVKPGDSFARIAQKTGVPAATLAQINGLKTSSMLHPDQKLKLPATAATGTGTTTSAASPRSAGATYKVQPGDTYYSISKKHGVSTDSLIAANPNTKPAALRPGQLVNLGTPQAATASAPAPTPAPATSPPSPATSSRISEEITSTPADEKKIRPIMIDGEMTYGDFAMKYGTDTERLNALNGLDLTNATVLAKGSELYVPAQP